MIVRVVAAQLNYVLVLRTGIVFPLFGFASHDTRPAERTVGLALDIHSYVSVLYSSQ